MKCPNCGHELKHLFGNEIWCPGLFCSECWRAFYIVIERKLDDVIMFAVSGTGKIESVWRKRQGEPVTRLVISDGICDACRVKWMGGA